jgi:hypothetical protein
MASCAVIKSAVEQNSTAAKVRRMSHQGLVLEDGGVLLPPPKEAGRRT